MAKTIKKKEIDEVEFNASGKPKEETTAVTWFNTIVPESDNKELSENRSNILQISRLVSRAAADQFHIYSTKENCEMFAAIFYESIIGIVEFMSSKQSVYKTFSMQLAKSINIGYTNNDDDDNEKIGNFMPFMEYIPDSNISVINSTDAIVDTTTKQTCIAWKNLNIKKNAEYFHEIEQMIFKGLVEKYNIDTRSTQCLIPLTCIFVDTMHDFLKAKYMEAAGTDVSEIKLNVMNLFTVYYSYDEDEGKDIYEYTPHHKMKLTLKSDVNAI